MFAQCSPGVSISLSKEAPLPRKGVPLTWKYQNQFAHAYINHLGTRHRCTRNTALCCQAVTNGVAVHSQNWPQPDVCPGCVHPLQGLISSTTPKGVVPCPCSLSPKAAVNTTPSLHVPAGGKADILDPFFHYSLLFGALWGTERPGWTSAESTVPTAIRHRHALPQDQLSDPENQMFLSCNNDTVIWGRG